MLTIQALLITFCIDYKNENFDFHFVFILACSNFAATLQKQL